MSVQPVAAYRSLAVVIVVYASSLLNGEFSVN